MHVAVQEDGLVSDNAAGILQELQQRYIRDLVVHHAESQVFSAGLVPLLRAAFDGLIADAVGDRLQPCRSCNIHIGLIGLVRHGIDAVVARVIAVFAAHHGRAGAQSAVAHQL